MNIREEGEITKEFNSIFKSMLAQFAKTAITEFDISSISLWRNRVNVFLSEAGQAAIIKETAEFFVSHGYIITDRAACIDFMLNADFNKEIAAAAEAKGTSAKIDDTLITLLTNIRGYIKNIHQKPAMDDLYKNIMSLYNCAIEYEIMRIKKEAVC